MNLLALPTTIPWLSLTWLSLLLPVIIIALLPADRARAIRLVGTGFAAVSLLLTVLIYLGYDPARSGFQFTEQLPWLPQIGISYALGIDGISLPLLLLNGIVVFAAALVSWNITERPREYWALLLLLAAGVHGVFVSLDLALLFVFYELAVLPMYLLIGVWGSTRREYGALKLTLYLMGGSALILIGLVMLYYSSGLQTFDARLIAQSTLIPQARQVVIFPLLFTGFAVLAGMFPFHTWSPVGHVAAPTAVSMLHAGVLMKLGAYGCLRVALWLVPGGAAPWLPWIALLAVIGAVYGALVAATQRDLKFMIGYSSVSHMALVILGLAAGSAAAITGATLQMFAHGVMTALLFAVVGRMVYDRTHTRQLDELGGLGRVLPLAAGLFLVAALSSMGMPGFAGFWAELNILIGTWERFPLAAAVAALSIPITAGYVLRAAVGAFFGPLRQPEFAALPPLSAPEIAAGLLLAAVVIIAGIAPAWLTEPISASVRFVADGLAQR